MHVGAINNYSFTSRRHRTSPRNNEGKIIRDDSSQQPQLPQKSGMSSGAKGLALAMMMIPAGMALVPNLTSCNANAEAYSYSDCHGCGCDTCGEPQIIHDTIGLNDTVWIKPNYESPVIDTTNSILNNLGITPGDGVPVRLTYIDELNTTFNKYIFNGDASSKDQVIYDVKEYEWDDLNGTFNMIDELANKKRVRLTLTKDGGLYVQTYVPKQGVNNPHEEADFRLTDVAYELMNADAGNVMIRREDNQSGVFVPDGVVEQGAIPGSVQITNGYNTSWRWTNIDGVWMTVPKSKN